MTTNNSINTYIEPTTSNEVTMPLQPCFSAYQNAPILGITGAGAIYTAVFNTEELDQGNNFDSVSTFTAPVNGNYLFNVTVSLSNITGAANICEIKIINSAGSNYLVGNFNPSNYIDATAFMRYSASAILPLNATEGITVTIQISGEAANTINYNGSGTRENVFSGTLLC